ncbi:hypothetical protein [Thermocrinis sp.]|uniref:hypothetical protein n=1 Tax=Thermocrinis sp. TaxID=2024383 RepID=UPI002FDC85F8
MRKKNTILRATYTLGFFRITGVDGEKDEEIINVVHFLHKKYRLSRVYFSVLGGLGSSKLGPFPHRTKHRRLSSAKEIIRRRRERKLTSPEDLKGIRNQKKILNYTTLGGRYYGKKQNAMGRL